MAATFRYRALLVNQVAFDHVDIFQSDYFTRIVGLIPSNVTLALRLNNNLVNWPLVSGVGVSDSQIAAGSVYWSELSNHSYGIRFFPNALGLWSLEVSYSLSPQQIVCVDYDVKSSTVADSSIRVGFCP